MIFTAAMIALGLALTVLIILLSLILFGRDDFGAPDDGETAEAHEAKES